MSLLNYPCDAPFNDKPLLGTILLQNYRTLYEAKRKIKPETALKVKMEMMLF